MSSPAPEHVADAPFDPGTHIMHHILDSHEIEIPFTSIEIPLPRLEIAGHDVSITRNVVMMWIASAILLTLCLAAARRAKNAVPTGIRGVMEALVLFVRDEIARKTIDRKYADRYVGYLLTAFFFILTCNFLGMIPGLSTPTSSISVTPRRRVHTPSASGAASVTTASSGHSRTSFPTGFLAHRPRSSSSSIISMLGACSRSPSACSPT
jgi:hypothetical protein